MCLCMYVCVYPIPIVLISLNLKWKYIAFRDMALINFSQLHIYQVYEITLCVGPILDDRLKEKLLKP